MGRDWASGLRDARRYAVRAALRRMIPCHLTLLRKIFKSSPIGLPYWLCWRRALGLLTRAPNPLSPPHDLLYRSGRPVAVPELAGLVTADMLSGWTLDAESISLVWMLLGRDAPSLILECGSGVSTLVFARFASLACSRGRRCSVMSMEQDQQIREKVDVELAQAGLRQFARVCHVPLRDGSDYDAEAVGAALALVPRRHADFVFIDGPYGPPGCRAHTLTTLLPYLRNGARWLMDDAFRDGELSILRRWAACESLTVTGIYPIGKGLATGSVRLG